MAINRSRVKSSSAPTIGMSFGELRSLVDIPGSSWQVVQQVPQGAKPYYYSAINDETGPRSSKTRPCEHVRTQVDNYLVQGPNATIEQSGNTYVYQCDPWCFPASYVPTRGDFNSIVDSFNRRSIRSIVDEVPTSVSLPTFIGEISDIPRTIKSIRDLASLPFEGLNPGKFENFRALKEAKRGLSDPILAWNFGVVPLWNDIRGFLSAQLGVNRRIDELRRTRGKLTKFRLGGKTKWSSWADDFAPAGSFSPFGIEARWFGHSQIVMRVGGEFYHELGGLDTYANQEAALRSSLGFDDLFRSAWDLLPFSFLADYVSNIGDLLGELKTNDAFTGEIQLRDTWSTTKETHKASQEVRYRAPGGKILSGGIMSSGEHVVFQRTSGIPTTAGLVLGNSVSARQLVNIAALV